MNTIGRDAVIEAIESVETQTYSFGGQTHDDCVGTVAKIIEAVRALKSQPAQPDPRDEALRLARSKLARAAAHVWPTCPALYGELKEALAAIDEVMKGK